MAKKLTQKEFIKRSNIAHGGIYDYSRVVYVNVNTKVEIYCEKHDIVFNQGAAAHIIGGTGCTQCEKQKIKNTMVERYGVENPMHSSEIQEKLKRTMVERHGVENPMHLSEVHKKLKQTNLDRYGVEYPAQSKEIYRKVKQTNLKRYGVEYALQSNEFKEKSKQTNIERYGVEYALQSKEIHEKAKQTNLERYGVENYKQSHMSKESLISLNNPIWLKEQHHTNKLTLTKISEILGVNRSTVGDYYRKHNIEIKNFAFSMGEKEVLEYITAILPQKTTIQANIRTIIQPYELDIYIPEYNLAIEYNGEYWHRNSQEKDNMKKELCEKQGIALLTIWENEWLNSTEATKNVLKQMINR